ncbi:MAG: PIN domain-containing protein [Acidimicrobiales bacterium]
MSEEGRRHQRVDTDGHRSAIDPLQVAVGGSGEAVGYSARTATDHRTLLTAPPISSMPVEYLTPKIEDRAVELQLALAERDHHRAPSDLLIAATVELADLTVLHLDKDFELIAELTGQPTERLTLT